VTRMNSILKKLLCFVFALSVPLGAYAGRTHEVFFKGTDHELDIYRIYGQGVIPSIHPDCSPDMPRGSTMLPSDTGSVRCREKHRVLISLLI